MILISFVQLNQSVCLWDCSKGVVCIWCCPQIVWDVGSVSPLGSHKLLQSGQVIIASANCLGYHLQALGSQWMALTGPQASGEWISTEWWRGRMMERRWLLKGKSRKLNKMASMIWFYGMFYNGIACFLLWFCTCFTDMTRTRLR